MKIINFNNSKRQFLKISKGFTLVEALIAMSILIVGIISSFILVTRALYNTNIIQDRLTASFLAQEGLELVRNLRDSNFVKKINGQTINWNAGLTSGKYRISTDINSGTISLSPDNINDPLYFHDDTGFFDYSSSGGMLTSFSRTIEIQTVSSDELRIIVTVNWQTKGITYTLQAEDHLFNWLPIE